MNPLNLSGPQFLKLYITLLAMAIVAALVLRELIRRGSSAARWTSTPPRLDPFEMALLAGGQRRALQAAVVSLVQKGAVQFRSAGEVRATGESAHNPSMLEAAVMTAVKTGPSSVAGIRS